VLHILYQQYQKPTFVTLTAKVLNLLSFQMTQKETDENPTVRVAELQATYAEWERKDIFRQLTKDNLFALVLAKGLPKGCLTRTKVIDAICDKIRDVAENPEKFAGDPTVVFDCAVQCINQIDENNTFGVTDKRGSAQQPDARRNNNPFYRRVPADSAASAEEGEEANSASAPVPVYSGEVARALGVTCVDPTSQKVFPYVAVKSQATLCSTCYGSKPVCCRQSGRFCYAAMCARCKFFGHRAVNCLQTHSSNGTKLK